MFQSVALVCFSFVIWTHCPRRACPKAFIGVHSFDVFSSGDVCNVQNVAEFGQLFSIEKLFGSWQKAAMNPSSQRLLPGGASYTASRGAIHGPVDPG